MKCILLLALVLECIGPLQAQDRSNRPDPSASAAIVTQAARLLDSDDIAAQAWGAFLAGQYRLTALLPRLVAYLPPPTNEAHVTDAQDCFYRSLVDALIRLDADIPADTLSQLYRRYPDESIILLPKSSGDNQASLLSIFQQQMPTLRWRAIGNMLAEARAPGLTSLLMRQMQEINVSIAVWDDNGGVGCGGSIGSGTSERTVPEGFPPVALYSLTDKPERTVGIVASQPHPIYYQRWVFELGDHFRMGSPGSVWDSDYGDGRDHFRFEYLALMLDERLEDVEFDSRPARTIQWQGPTEYLRKVELVCARVLEQYDALVVRLAAYGLLSQYEATGLNARVHLRIHDFREDKGIRLPEISMDRAAVEP